MRFAGRGLAHHDPVVTVAAGLQAAFAGLKQPAVQSRRTCPPAGAVAAELREQEAGVVGLVPDRPHVDDIAVAPANGGHEALEAHRTRLGEVVCADPGRLARHGAEDGQQDPQDMRAGLGQEPVVAREPRIRARVSLVEGWNATGSGDGATDRQ